MAEVCWAYANKGEPYYHDVPGYGYVEMYLTRDGCGKATVASVTIVGAENMTSQQVESLKLWFLDHMAQKVAEAGGKLANFKNSEFTEVPDLNWS